MGKRWSVGAVPCSRNAVGPCSDVDGVTPYHSNCISRFATNEETYTALGFVNLNRDSLTSISRHSISF